jgi:hypothetical protein
MQVQVQSCGAIHRDRRLVNDISRTVERDLHRYDGRIRNVDVLMIEDDDSPDEKWCIVEARLPGREPIAVRAHARSFERAAHAGAAKLEQVIGEATARRASYDLETVDWTPDEMKE